MMFIPNEPAYILAMQLDSGLWDYAYRKRILLISPTNLVASLKVVSDLWKREYQSRNAQEIAKRGAILYDKFAGFVDTLQGYGLEVMSAMLSQIVRQAESSGILYNATNIRNILNSGETEAFPKIKLDNFTDIVRISGEELIDEISAAYDRDGIENTMIISRSNKRTNIYNQGVRNRILWREEELSSGDLLMIAKNSYFWTEKIDGIDFLANGEIVEVLRVRRTQELYGFRFCDIEIRSLDYDIEMEVKVVLDTLYSDAAGLTRERANELFYNVLEDYADISTKAGKMQRMKIDPFFNALQVKFAYAVTCHKAQGGEWKNVFLDLGYIAEEHLGVNFYRWLYTAITRATDKLYLVNLADDFL